MPDDASRDESASSARRCAVRARRSRTGAWAVRAPFFPPRRYWTATRLVAGLVLAVTRVRSKARGARQKKRNQPEALGQYESRRLASVQEGIVLRRLRNRQHPFERDAVPVLLLVWNNDSVVHATLAELVENPEQMVGRDAEHRRTEAAELIE